MVHLKDVSAGDQVEMWVREFPFDGFKWKVVTNFDLRVEMPREDWIKKIYDVAGIDNADKTIVLKIDDKSFVHSEIKYSVNAFYDKVPEKGGKEIERALISYQLLGTYAYDYSVIKHIPAGEIYRPRLETEPLTCKNCNDIVPMAAANQPDGVTFICYQCRQDPYSRSWKPVIRG